MLNLINENKPFALIEKDGRVNLYIGEIQKLAKLDDIHQLACSHNSDIVFVLPYRVIQERGFHAKGDEPILGLSIETQHSFRREDVLAQLPKEGLEIDGAITPSLSDDEYAAMVADFQAKEVAKGYVSQTTLSRKYNGKVKTLNVKALLGAFRKIIEKSGHYMAVLFYNPADHQVILAATPERHLEVTGTQTIMTPIAGTLRKEDQETFPARLQAFIHDEKEINELFQVLDEEMKIMGLICPEGGRIEGPFLREVGAVVHSEYNLIGKRTLNSIDALRETLHAPTVVGSPMESAARVIAKYEQESRRYYAGEIGVYKNPRTTAPDGDIDAAILIRMAEFFGDGSFSVQSGGGLVRDSVPLNEAKESIAKAQGILNYLTLDGAQPRYLSPALTASIDKDFKARNDMLSTFWMDKQDSHALEATFLKDKTVTIINNEDNFAYMIEHTLRPLKAEVRVVDTFAYDAKTHAADIIIVGPGPGDPNDPDHPRMQKLRKIVKDIIERNQPMLGICLGHQMLCKTLGYDVALQPKSSQGLPKIVKIKGKDYQLGFYNSYSAVAKENEQDVFSDNNGRIMAIYKEKAIGFQFHPESVMSRSGVSLIYDAMEKLV